MKVLSFFLIIMLVSICLYAQNDADGCKDHSMFTRMPNTYISECSKNFNEMEIPIAEGKTIKQEGMKTYIIYTYDNDKPGTPPSFFQIVKNYENEVVRFGGKKIYFQNGAYSTQFLKSAKKEIWIVLEDFTATNGDGNYAVSILEKEEMQQDIKASVILDKLNTVGFIALYINFETGKSTIKTESQQIITQLADMLTQNPSLKISIEGHTDNTGSSASNQTLSLSRADAVKGVLVNRGIDKSRLSTKGWGQTKPISDNGTNEGKALNRRVEIIKQ